jgi:hypothetical protein
MPVADPNPNAPRNEKGQRKSKEDHGWSMVKSQKLRLGQPS